MMKYQHLYGHVTSSSSPQTLKVVVTSGTEEFTDVSVGGKIIFLMVYIYSTFKLKFIMQSAKGKWSFFACVIFVRLHYFPGGLCAFEFNFNRNLSLSSRFTGSVGHYGTENSHYKKGIERRKGRKYDSL